MESSLTYNSLHPRSPADFIPFAKNEIEQSIPLRFEAQAAIYKNKIALKTTDCQITYDELDALANSIAHHLLRERSSIQEPIALICNQGIPLIAAILGILKAGKIYMPLDVYDPPERIASFLRESGCLFVITDAKNLSVTSSAVKDVNAGILNLDEFESAESGRNLSLTIPPEAYAYIFYTSGSTGKPKGVVDTHRNVLHNIMRYTNALNISPSDRLTLLQSANFSGSVSSLFCALLNGATSYPYNIKEQGLGKNIASWLKTERMTMYHSVPAIFRSFLSDDECFPDIRIIRLEGDAASVQDVELFKRHFRDDCLLVNGLGATETGIVRQYFVGKNTELSGGILPIGYPVEGMELFIVDENGITLPFHQAGEIAVRSKFLTSGYWKNDALSSTAFIPDNSDPKMRMYRTGDMGRMSEDGCVAYLGRKDFQLKIRGNRVDPAEVESHLVKLPEVKDAVVATRISSRGDGQLVAYIIPHGRPFPTHSYLRRRLGESLPEYMIPARFIMMESFPLNANLKVDRKALPDPEHVNRISSVRYQAPANSTEVSLVKIWESIFKISPIGINDNFFDLGGDSLYAAEIYTQVGKQFGKELDMRTLLQYPTVGRLAKFIAEDRRQGSTVLVPLQPFGSRRPLFCVHGHGGHVHAYVPLSRIIGSDQPLYGLQSQGESMSIFEAMASAYIKEIRNVQPNGPYSVAGFCYGGIIALEMAHQLVKSGEEVAHLIMFDVTPAEFTPLFSENILSAYYHHVKSERKKRFIAGLEGLPLQEKSLAILGSAVRKAGRIPQEFLEARRKNTLSSQHYTPVPFPGTVALFLSRETTASYTNNPLSVWNALSTVGVEVVLCTGEEGVMFSEPHVQFLASELNRILSSK